MRLVCNRSCSPLATEAKFEIHHARVIFAVTINHVRARNGDSASFADTFAEIEKTKPRQLGGAKGT